MKAQSQTVSAARRAAFEILRRVETEGAFASNLLASLDQHMRQDDRALVHELVLGVLRRQLWLDRVIEHFAARTTESLDLAVKLALRLGLYQIRFLSRTPDSAAVNESVNLVHAARLRSATSLVNAVLRRAARELTYDPAAGVHDAIERIAVETSHPAWLIRRWIDFLGEAEAERFARSNNDPAPVAFRMTPRAVEPGFVLEELRAAGADLQPSQLVSAGWRVRGASAVVQKLSRDGLIYLQDEASQLVANIVAPQAGERVLDVCAAPGSKALHLSAMQPRSVVIAGDLHAHRLSTLRRLAAQQGDSIPVVVHDATRDLPFAPESFDAVLVDAPCSGTGTLRHNPEIRWRITARDIGDLATRQQLILTNSARMVRDGGRLVYSTCSVEPEENEDIINAFREANNDFRLVEPRWEQPDGILPASLSSAGTVRTWPHKQDVDGFFIAALVRAQ